MAMVMLETPLSEIHGIPPRFFLKLKRLGIETVGELLRHFPTRYEDFSQIYKITDLIPGQEATVQGEVKDISGRRTWRRRLFLVEAVISDDSGSIRAVWFNQPYIRNVLQPGRLANFSGKVAESESGELYLSNPTYELIKHGLTRNDARIDADDIGENLRENPRESASIHTGRIVPVYPETRGLTSKGIRYLIKPLLDEVRAEESIPDTILRREGFQEINAALHNVHFPDDIADALAAKKRFAFEDLFFLQLHNLRERLRLAKEHAPVIAEDVPHVRSLIAGLPFTLTLSQKAALWEILQNLAKPHPMNRLLQGDVGSGKTVVAAIAALMAARAGYQTAFMAPTEILARQHYKTLIKFFPECDYGIALLTSSESKTFYGHNLETATNKPALKREINKGAIKIVLGTHALIQKDVDFRNLALVIVDEQHRFGVEQRSALQKNGRAVPHFLSMSATPIPRTLSLTIFGDLDLSLIDEMPKNRKVIITKVIPPVHREKAYVFIRNEIRKGRQAFVICPRIEPAQKNEAVNERVIETIEMKNIKEEYEKLSKKIFPDLRVAMLHGRMKAKEKEAIMRAFLARECDVLVSTSVVEVGVDVPNASIMMIESSERFGLAQLYQFRGRVGRGAHQSFCFLFTEATGKAAQQRLKSIVEAKNGFELAEKDLKIRGPGEFLGETQSGMPDLAMKAIQNPELVKHARDAAVEILEPDPALKNYPTLRAHLTRFDARVHRE